MELSSWRIKYLSTRNIFINIDSCLDCSCRYYVKQGRLIFYLQLFLYLDNRHTKMTYQAFCGCRRCCRHTDFCDAQLSLKRLTRESIRHIYKSTFNALRRRFVFMILMNTGDKIFNMVFSVNITFTIF